MTAELAAEVKRERADLGRQLLSGSLAPDEYLARVRDRNRKLHNAETIAGWMDALAKGDRDGDLVADDRDDCPGSPRLSATDDHGCPLRGPLPKAPSREEVERAKKLMRIAISPPCQDARPPSASTPLLIGRDQNAPDSFLIAVAKATEEAGKCPIFYNVRIHSRRSSFFSQTDTMRYFDFVFQRLIDSVPSNCL